MVWCREREGLACPAASSLFSHQQYMSMTWSDDVGETFTKTSWNLNTVADCILQDDWLTLFVAQFL